MFKVLSASKDAYITDRVINNVAQVSSNVGSAGSLDLFKLYGVTTTTSGAFVLNNTELSRLLIKFDLSALRTLVANGKVDPNNSSFSCKLHMFDVYGGQPTPSNFTVDVFPLSASFDEGLGRDVVAYSDQDVCNWLSGSANVPWFITGCGFGADASVACDYITTLNSASMERSQVFVTGFEDLDIDITPIVSSTIAGKLPDVGLRVAFDSTLENDQHTYFVKRFAGRSAFNSDLAPVIYVRFDDSIQDDTDNAYLDSTNYLFLYNYNRSALTNLQSGSTSIVGHNCLQLMLVSSAPLLNGSGTITLGPFSGSQLYLGINPQVGIYSASLYVSSTLPDLIPQWQASGSITFTPIWRSVDGTLPYLTGSAFKLYAPQRGSQALAPKRFEVTVLGVRSDFDFAEQTVLRVNIFDFSQSYVSSVSRLPVELPGVVVRDVHYQVRDVTTDRVVIPFDTLTNSTRVSNDSAGMYFTLDTANLTSGRTYVIDVMIVTGGNQQLYKAASPAFRVGDVQ